MDRVADRCRYGAVYGAAMAYAPSGSHRATAERIVARQGVRGQGPPSGREIRFQKTRKTEKRKIGGLIVRVRFPSPAPTRNRRSTARDLGGRIDQRPRAPVSGDPSVARLNELDRASAVPKVGLKGRRQDGHAEVLERREEPDRGTGPVHQVLQVEEVHVAREVAEQSEEVCVPGERVT